MRILMLLDNTFTIDRRVKREAEALVEKGHSLTLACMKSTTLPAYEMVNGIEIHRVFENSIFDPKQSNACQTAANLVLSKFEFDAIHAHDHTMLHVATLIKKKKNTTLIYDSHELFHSWPMNLSNFKSKRIFVKSLLVRKWHIRRERKNSKKIDYLVTVNQSLASNLQNYFKIDKSKICVVRNTPEYAMQISNSNILRTAFGIPDSHRILVFIGGNVYVKTLNVEQVFEEFDGKENVSIVVIATFNENSQHVKDYVKEKGYQNIYFHDKVSPEQINEYLASADVGLVPTWNKKDLSYWYALDNKLFEYLQAGIPILATKQPEYELIVEKHDIGVCVNADNPNAYFDGFCKILDNYEHYKSNTSEASKLLAWENEKLALTSFYDTILQNK